jgi:hypothetical protein
MTRSPTNKPLKWSEIAALAVLGGLVVFGLVANGLSLLQSLVSLGFGAGVLLIAWLWQLVLRRSSAATAPTRWQRAWGAAVFAAWLAATGAVVWWYAR